MRCPSGSAAGHPPDLHHRRFPGSLLGTSLYHAARMIAADLPARVYFVSLSGFDTHRDQGERHAHVLRELSDALLAFVRELEAQGNLDRTLVMTFSESAAGSTRTGPPGRTTERPRRCSSRAGGSYPGCTAGCRASTT